MGFEKNGMVYISQSSVQGQIFHWHDELELLLVVEGSIDLKVGYEWFRLEQGDIMLINSDEIHSIKETEEKNRIICVYMDCNICYEKFSDFYEIVAIWTYREAYEKLNQNKQAILDNVKNLASVLDSENNKDKVMQYFDMLLKSLVYCYRIDITNPNGASFQITNEKKDVIYRIIKYMYSNYDQKINLQEISEKEYMSLFYLSHSFKDITGYSFRDWLNFVRVEKAEKLLLKTTLPITEIAYQCGFSDVRYFNKHFVKWYKITPNKYRNLFKTPYELYNSAMGNFEKNVPIDNSIIIKNIGEIVPENKAANEKKEYIKINLEVNVVIERLDPSWKEALWYNGADLIDYKQIRQIEAAQKEIDFRSIIVDELFSSEIQKSGNSIIRNGHDILNFFLDRFAKVFLVISCSKDDQYEVNTAIEFLENFFKYNPRSRAVQIEFKLDKADNETETSEKINEFIHFLKDFNIGYKMYEKYKKPMDKKEEFESDYIVNMITGEIRLDWLYSKEGFKNNLYYFYSFLSKMGEAVVFKKERFIVTRKNKDYQVFFHNGIMQNYSYEKKYKVIIDHLVGKFKIVRFTWNIRSDDISNMIKNANVIKYLTDDEYELIDKLSTPEISIDYIDSSLLEDEKYIFDIDAASVGMDLTLLTKIE